MSHLHSKLTQEKADMKPVPLNRYDAETDLMRQKQASLFASMRAVFTEMNPAVQKLMLREDKLRILHSRILDIENTEQMSQKELNALYYQECMNLNKLKKSRV